MNISYENFNESDVNKVLESPEFIGLKNAIDYEEDLSANFSNDFKNSISEYYNSIVFGNKNLENIVEDFQNEIDKSMKEINDYLVRAEAARSEIRECMQQDIEAKKTAIDKYNYFMSNKNAYTEEVYDQNNILIRTVYNYTAHVADAKAAAQAEWEKLRCHLWG